MHSWNDYQDALLMPYVLRRANPRVLGWVARDLGKRRAEVCRRRRTLRRHLRRERGLAARPGQLAAA
jgi:hypothetical protein